jgi:hypothetical protein
MLGRNGRTLPTAPQPPSQPQPPQPNDEFNFNSDDSDDSQFVEWDEAYISDTEAEAAEEAAHWGKRQQQVPGDPEQVAILASFNVHRFRRLKEE